MSEIIKKKKTHKVLITILIVICLIVSFVLYSGITGSKKINNNLNYGLETISSTYALKKDEDNKFEDIRIYGVINFHVNHYEAEGLGNVCTMKMNFGVVQMFTLVITPYEKQMPMLSIDYIITPVNYKEYVEFYDLVPDTSTQEYQSILKQVREVLDKYSDLTEFKNKSAWFDVLITDVARKEGSPSQNDRFEELFKEVIDTYINISISLPTLSKDEQTEKLNVIDDYINKSIANPGFSTKTFKDQLGEDGIKEFLFDIFYGSNNYR